MTTRELADLLDHLKQGLGPFLKMDTTRAFDEATAAFREIPDQPLKKLAEQLRTTTSPGRAATSKKSGKVLVDVPSLIERIRAVRNGIATDEISELDSLNMPQLRQVLAAFGQKGAASLALTLARVKQLLESSGESNGTSPADSVLIDEGVRLYTELRDTRGLAIEEVRTRFAPLSAYSKHVLDEISRRVGYTPSGSRKETLDRLQSNLEDMKLHQLRAELVGSGA